jgi:hypothetical protein
MILETKAIADPMEILFPKSLLLLTALSAILHSYFYYAAIHVLHLPPYRSPYPVSILGSALMVFLPLWGYKHEAERASYVLAIFACVTGFGLCFLSVHR